MTQAHRDAQTIFRELGAALGYTPTASFSPTLPTDGVWTVAAPLPNSAPLPVVAVEVVVSESRKTVRGSILTLEMVSPALGVLLIHEDELRRRHIRAGGTSAEADRRVESVRSHALEFASTSRRRIEVWSFAVLRQRFQEVTGLASLYQIPAHEVAARAA
jgi:hypothetical protein